MYNLLLAYNRKNLLTIDDVVITLDNMMVLYVNSSLEGGDANDTKS